MWRLLCHFLFLIFPSFGALGRLGFMTVAFPGYHHLYFSPLMGIHNLGVIASEALNERPWTGSMLFYMDWSALL